MTIRRVVMGAEVLMWVEVERPVKEWRKSYGVTTYDALENVKLNIGERLTGVVKATLDGDTKMKETYND
jgi:hypothetical protein